MNLYLELSHLISLLDKQDYFSHYLSMLSQAELESFIEDCHNLLENIDIGQWISEKADIDAQLSQDNAWDNPSATTKLTRQAAHLQHKIDQVLIFQSHLKDLQAAIDLNEDAEAERTLKILQKEFTNIQNAQFLGGKFDSYDTLLTIHAGAGGVDAQDFAAMLASMYQAFCKREGWQTNLIYISPGEEGGVKTLQLKVIGHNSYGFLKEEAGVHRLVRLSPFNSGKTRETSFALVEVLPDGLDKEIDIELDEKDLKWDYFMSSGKGGQSVNTTYSAVRVVHLPTNLSATCQNERNQIQNKQQALEILKGKIAAQELKKQKELTIELKGDIKSAEWGSQIRSYILHPYKLVKDHRSGWEGTNPNEVLEEGDILPIIWSVKHHEQALKNETETNNS